MARQSRQTSLWLTAGSSVPHDPTNAPHSDSVHVRLRFPNLRRAVGTCVVAIVALAAIAPEGKALDEPLLHRARLRLEPAAGQLQTLPRFQPRWHLSADLASRLRPELEARGFGAELIAVLSQATRFDAGTRESGLVPTRELLARFSARQRAAWHELLCRHPGNETYRWPLSLGPTELASLDAQPRWREAMQRLRATAIPHGERLAFGDLFVLEDAFASPEDRLEFFRIALGGEALFLKLRRKTDAPLDPAAQARWWQVNGRYRAIEPLLSAVAAIPDAPRLDVTHVLPSLARSLINTFPPNLGEAGDAGVESSLMASDFFALTPGADARRETGFRTWLDATCVPVTGELRYGDLLVYGDLEQSPWPYTVVYIAGGVGFARRPTLGGAWQFLDLQEIGALNPRFAGKAPRIFRSRATQVEPGEPPFDPGRLPAAWRRRLELKPLKPGPWGKLWYYDVLLAPSSSTLERVPPPDTTPEWTFQGLARNELLAIVNEVEMTPEVRRDLTALFNDRRADDAGSIRVRPSLELVLKTPREFRARAFPHLVGGGSVSDYAQHIPFPKGFTIEEWFDADSLPPSTREAILRLVYPSGDRVMLSDYGALYHLLPSNRERLSAQRAALRAPARVVLLEKPAKKDVPALAEYWRRISRTKSTDRLLQSFAEQDTFRYLDVIHFLSPIEREFVNTYFLPDEPTPTPSCFWTAFNFGEDRPDDRFLVVPGIWTEHGELAWRELNEKFDRLPAPQRVGDIIGYRQKGASTLDHVCVFIADDLVYTKNGFTFSSPWCLSPLAEVDERYLSGPDVERVYFRRRLPAAPAP